MEQKKRNSKEAAGQFVSIWKEIDRFLEDWTRNFIDEIEKQKRTNVN